MDVHCGWCYGNSDSISTVVHQLETQIDFELLTGGMWLGENAPKGGNGLYQFIQNHSPQMEATTGAYVDPKFYNLTKDSTYVFNSLEPSCAIALIKEWTPSITLEFSKAVQHSIFAQGKKLDQLETYLPILEKLKIDVSQFKEKWMTQKNILTTTQEFESGRKIARGFPTLALQTNNDIQIIASGYFNPDIVIKNINSILTTKTINHE